MLAGKGVEFGAMRTAALRAALKAKAIHDRSWADREEEEGEVSEGGESVASSTAKIRKGMAGGRFDIR